MKDGDENINKGKEKVKKKKQEKVMERTLMGRIGGYGLYFLGRNEPID